MKHKDQITPGQIGEIIRGGFLARRGYSLSVSSASVVLERIFDLVLLILVAFPGFKYFFDIRMNYLQIFLIL